LETAFFGVDRKGATFCRSRKELDLAIAHL